MSEKTVSPHYGERIRYEDLLLIWLDRINQSMLYLSEDKMDPEGIGVEKAIRSIRTFYSLLPRTIRSEIDRRIGNNLLKYIDYHPHSIVILSRGYLLANAVILMDYYNEFKEAKKKCSEYEGNEAQYYACVSTLCRAYNLKTMKRLEEVLQIIVDVLYDYNLLLREEYELEAREVEDQT